MRSKTVNNRRFAGRAGRALLAAAVCLALLAAAAFDGAPRSTASAEDTGLRISEVMSSNASTQTGAETGLTDWVELENTSDAPIDLTGYALMRATKPAKAFAFPGGVIQPGEYLVIYCDGSTQARQEDGWHAPFNLPASGDALTLLDKHGNTLDSVDVPALDRDQTYCRDVAGAWKVSDFATPGAVNHAARDDGAGTVQRTVSVTPGALEISEVMAKNATFFPDENGEFSDYVEIRNISSGPVNLEGWCLSDTRDKLTRWRFPAVTLPAGAVLAVHCDGEDRRADPKHLHASFKLNSDGDEVYLTSPKGVTVSYVRTPMLEPDQAFSKLETGWSKAFVPTPGQPNTFAGADAAARTIESRNTCGVVISEIMASSGNTSDWIELYNGGSAAVDLSGYGLSDKASRPRKWQFPEGTVIQPGAYLGVVCNGSDGYANGRAYSSYALSVSGGYSVVLSEPDGTIFDRVFVPMQYQNISYGRTSDGALRYFTQPTPEAANGGPTYYGRAPMPEYSTYGGLFKTGDVLNISLAVPSGCRVYYTLDNTDPNESKTLYTSPIPVTGTTILRTRVYGDGYLDSFMDSQSYLYDVNNADGTVYVVSLVSDPYNLTSDEAGIMVSGPNAWPEYPYGSMNNGANFWMDWEREAHVEVFNPDGSTLVSQECGIKLHGQYSRAEAQKAFKVIARSQYGSNRFEGAIFSHRDYTEYQSFLLRSSSEDGNKTRFRDAVLQMLARGTSVMYQETEVGVLYIDGRYWGHYNLRERICKSSICQFEGWEGDEDDIDLIKANTGVMQGSNETFARLRDWVKANNTNTDEAYALIDSMVDIRNYIEYMAIEIYTGNTDTLNVKRYRNPKTDGKWRWVLFDLDWAFNEDTNSVTRWLRPGGMGNGNRTDNSFFIACMKNDRFRDEFLTYLGEQMATTFSPQSVLGLAEDMYYTIKPLLPDQFARWDQTESKYASALRVFINYANNRPYRMLQFIKYCTYLNLSQAQMEHYFGAVMEREGKSYADITKP